MFGFGNDKNGKKADSIKETAKWSAINRTFGTTDVDEVLKEYMPELSDAILRTAKNVVQNGNNQVVINDNINQKHEELLKELDKLRQAYLEAAHRNRELQAKYDALVERMAGYIERENGKGR